MAGGDGLERGAVRVLLLEEDPEYAKAILGTLELCGPPTRITLAPAPEVFKTHLQTGTFDLLVCDVPAKPNGNGELLRWVRSSHRDLPLIILGEIEQFTPNRENGNGRALRDNLERLPQEIRRALQEKERTNQESGIQREFCKSEGEYQLLFDLNPVPMYVLDLSTLNFLDVNQAMD